MSEPDARLVVENQIAREFIGTQIWRMKEEHRQAFAELGDAERSLIDSIAGAILLDLRTLTINSIEPPHVQWILFCLFRPMHKSDWVSRLENASRQDWFVKHVADSEDFAALRAWLDGAAPMRELLSRQAHWLGIEPPASDSPVEIARFLCEFQFSHLPPDAPGATVSYRSLTEHDVAELLPLLAAIPSRRRTQSLPFDVLQRIAVSGPARLTAYLGRQIAIQEETPGVLFLAADENVQTEILESHNPNLISLLAWAPSDRSERWLAEHPNDLAEWRALQAGWEITPAGKRRDLILQAAFELVPERTPGSRECALVKNRGTNETLLLDLDLTDEQIPTIALDRDALRIPLMVDGTPIYFDIDDNGHARPRLNNPDPYVKPTQEAVPLCRGARRATAYETTYPAQLDPISQLGGVPHWEQEPDYPECPDCGDKMLAIACIDLRHASAAGIAYAFLCCNCEVAATLHQID